MKAMRGQQIPSHSGSAVSSPVIFYKHGHLIVLLVRAAVLLMVIWGGGGTALGEGVQIWPLSLEALEALELDVCGEEFSVFRVGERKGAELICNGKRGKDYGEFIIIHNKQ